MSETLFDRRRLDELLDEVKWGQADDADLDAVAGALEKGEIAGDRVYTAVHILGRAARSRHEAQVAKYLDGSHGPMVARVALSTLCGSFGAAAKYRLDLLRFIRWEPWDEADDVRLVALSRAGEHLRNDADHELFETVLAVAEDDAELPLARLAALSALGRALGDGWDDLPTATASSFDREWAHTVVARARRRARH